MDRSGKERLVSSVCSGHLSKATLQGFIIIYITIFCDLELCTKSKRVKSKHVNVFGKIDFQMTLIHHSDSHLALQSLIMYMKDTNCLCLLYFYRWLLLT